MVRYLRCRKMLYCVTAAHLVDLFGNVSGNVKPKNGAVINITWPKSDPPIVERKLLAAAAE